MTGILTQLKTVANDLNELQAKWALVGALAVSVHTEPRTTRDIDVAVVFEAPGEQERLIAQLIERGYFDSQLLFIAPPTKKIGVRLHIPAEINSSVALDLLSACTGIEAETIASATTIEIVPGIHVPIASRAHTLAMKILSQNDSDRVRDKADVQRLMAEASPPEMQAAREALELIQHRGYARGKDLPAEFEQDLRRYKNLP